MDTYLPPRTLREALSLARLDLDRRLVLQGRHPTLFARLTSLFYRGGFAVMLFRLLDFAHTRGWRRVVKVGQLVLYLLGRAEIHHGARIGPGLVLPDIGGIGLPAFCDIGRNCTFIGPALLTLGGMEGVDLDRDRIILGDDCVVGSNVRIIGAVSLGRGTQVKAGSVVMTSFNKEGHLLSGVPARRRAVLPLEKIRGRNHLQAQPLAPGHSMQTGENLMRQTFSKTIDLLKQDIAFRCEYEHKPVTTLNIIKFLLNPGVLCVVLFRLQVFFYQHLLKPLAGLLEYMNLVLFAVSIDSRAKIAGGLTVIHANAVYVSQHAVIGRNFLMFHQNSIGFSPFFEKEEVVAQGPLIGDNVILGAGASIYGPVTVGDRCKIAVNASVDADCPPDSVMFGVPARQVSKT